MRIRFIVVLCCWVSFLVHAGTLDKTVSRTPLGASARTTVPFLCHDDGRYCEGGTFATYVDASIHTGHDLDNAYDGVGTETRVVSMLPGSVATTPVTCVPATCSSMTGNMVAVEHLIDDGTRWYALYLHLLYVNGTQPGQLAAGSRVAAGQLLGYKGATGNAGGSHLHIEMSSKATAEAIAECAPHWRPACVNGVRTADNPAQGSTFLSDPKPYLAGGRRALVPYFSSTAAPDEATYAVYGIHGQPLHAALPLRPTQTVTYQRVGVGGRDELGSIADLFVRDNNPTVTPGAAAITGSRTFTCSRAEGCDFKFFAYLRTTAGVDLSGYPMKVTILPSGASEILDNDGRAVDQSSCTLEPRPGLYVGCERDSGYHHGYYLTARLFPSNRAGYFARWFPSRPGRYRVFVHVPTNVPSAATNVVYKIYERGPGTPAKTSAAVSHDLRAPGMGAWVELRVGTETSWTFQANGYIGLATEGMADGQHVAVDAVKFIAVP